MTPTYFGRVQTRLLLLSTFGVVVSWFFIVTSFRHDGRVYIALFLVALFGIGWDLLYHYWQQRRWDHDWPPSHQLLAGIIEGVFLWFIMVPFFGVLSGAFWSHYSTVWLVTFLASQSIMRILFPRWRYRGGEWL